MNFALVKSCLRLCRVVSQVHYHTCMGGRADSIQMWLVVGNHTVTLTVELLIIKVIMVTGNCTEKSS